MKIDFDQPIRDPLDQPIKIEPGSDKIATLAHVASSALFSHVDTDATLDGHAKAKIGDLGLRVFKGGKQEASPEEIVLIRERVAKVFPPLYAARVRALTEG